MSWTMYPLTRSTWSMLLALEAGAKPWVLRVEQHFFVHLELLTRREEEAWLPVKQWVKQGIAPWGSDPHKRVQDPPAVGPSNRRMNTKAPSCPSSRMRCRDYYSQEQHATFIVALPRAHEHRAVLKERIPCEDFWARRVSGAPPRAYCDWPKVISLRVLPASMFNDVAPRCVSPHHQISSGQWASWKWSREEPSQKHLKRFKDKNYKDYIIYCHSISLVRKKWTVAEDKTEIKYIRCNK